MTEKEIVHEIIRGLPGDCTLDELAGRIKFMAAIQKALMIRARTLLTKRSKSN